MSRVQNVWILAEKTEGIAELCSGAQVLGEQVAALLIGAKEKAEQAICLGAQKVYWLGEPADDTLFEDYTDTILNLIQQEKPPLLLIQATKRGKLMAGRLAAGLNSTVLTDIMELVEFEGSLVASHRVYGGSAIRKERALSEITIATVGSGLFEPAAYKADSKGSVIEVPFVEPRTKIKLLARKGRGTVSVNLPAAKRIVSVGRGVARQENLRMIEELASLLEAEVGCTRPIAEGLNWLPRERYIGVSGAMVKPDLYFAIGVSGQVQHMVGANQSRTIAAINTDKAAPIFAQADFGLVGDLYKIVPILIAKLKTK